jgi:hypothetical protein
MSSIKRFIAEMEFFRLPLYQVIIKEKKKNGNE